MKKQFRVVSVNVMGTFRRFADDREAAVRFLLGYEQPEANGKVVKIGPGQLGNDPRGTYRLESRPFSMVGNDSTWTEEQP